ncbi:flagellar basal body rod protein FlgC [Trinickia terrae]|uniref:Flagellar basal-body rod protein FlgC n=1 Tax=Trinickia terrae TaxID=2571161 RepID=A0A4U1I7Q9_9BURK|nr:flagellar basal body rod protein FlgC [Trinickia terrae]TKC89462.1 flagellar basal body rod protein FlgC [Trinickia terrae]
MSEGIFAIARSGLDVERQRMEVIAQNLANAGTTRTATGEPYQPMRLISAPRVETETVFARELNGSAVAQASSSTLAAGGLTGAQALAVEPTNAPPRVVHDPSHPQADAHGMVRYPGIDHAGEMSLMVQTLRVYEANVVMFNAARSMYMRALEIGNKG